MCWRMTDYFLESFSGPKSAEVWLLPDRKESWGGEAMPYCLKTFLATGGSGMEDGSWLGRSGP